eukprot:gene12606-biopygen9014
MLEVHGIRKEHPKATQEQWKAGKRYVRAWRGGKATAGSNEPTQPKQPRRLGILMQKWHKAWNAIKEELAPRKLVIMRTQGSRLSSRAKAAVKARSRARRRHLGQRSDETKRVYYEAAQTAKRIIQEDNAATIQKRREEAGDNPKACWKLRRELAGKARPAAPQPSTTPDAANRFFIDKPRRVQEATRYAPLAHVTKREVPTLERFEQVEVPTVLRALKAARTTWSTGVDGVPMAMLKKVAVHIAPHLAELTNAITREQEWPRCWKTSQICAIWKNKGSRREVKTYRPVALLPAVSRIVEKIISYDIMRQVQAAQALPDGQHGFRAKHGTHTAILQLIQSITKILEQGRDCVVAAMDLSAAFDTVHHGLLLEKLRDRVGLRAPALSLIQSYLQGRQQRVQMHGKTSGALPIESGVPQGSVLGPILFSLSVGDLKENFTDIDIVQYADDCTLVIPVEPGTDPAAETTQRIQRFVDYCAANRIAAEPDKTQLLHVRATLPRASRTTYKWLRPRLPGRWRAVSTDLEVPKFIIGNDLFVRFDDGDQVSITEGPQGQCCMGEWIATGYRAKGRQIHWSSESSSTLVKWIPYANQPAKILNHPSASDSDSESESSAESDSEEEEPAAACVLGGKTVCFREHIKVLGMTIDRKLTWRQHCEAMAAKARSALAATRRGARHLRPSDRRYMVQALALPYVKYNQEVFGSASTTAKFKLRRAYNACARMAARTERTAEALKVLNWPTYAAQQEAAQEKFATKVATQQEPRCLYELLCKAPSPPKNEVVTARRRAQVWTCPKRGHRLGVQAFSYWAPRHLQAKAEADLRKAADIEERRQQAAACKQIKKQ